MCDVTRWVAPPSVRGASDLRLERLQRQGNDPRHAAVEGFILQAHQAVKGQGSPSHYRSDPCLVQTTVVFGAEIHQHLKERDDHRGGEIQLGDDNLSSSPRLSVWISWYSSLLSFLPLGCSCAGSCWRCRAPSGTSLSLVSHSGWTRSLRDKLTKEDTHN